MLKLELLVGVKLAQAEPLLVLLDGMETGAVAWRQSTHLLQKKASFLPAAAANPAASGPQLLPHPGASINRLTFQSSSVSEPKQRPSVCLPGSTAEMIHRVIRILKSFDRNDLCRSFVLSLAQIVKNLTLKSCNVVLLCKAVSLA